MIVANDRKCVASLAGGRRDGDREFADTAFELSQTVICGIIAALKHRPSPQLSAGSQEEDRSHEPIV